ncbi:tryptophan synthase subunit alpha [Clostridium botulinum]|uniref:tryptophan synthase n=2 Tax=Clostridium botulinum TaxID=1491 RepID=A0A6B4R2Z8_CLOBO|nr:tryptophan synthase subunit alpha [Clostridium botulinum]MBY6921430.1 tryptophan synthase subunit alpha [Clostridium botulinum]NFG24006.1 tryptophan synthase subunit alpha [Clostridium botulinum]NFH70693.1 tryptophan synthase subunit alpha [Clostridium botulinum]NFJ59384.1 tryptophan synthase subunit alpha [Clostridium botulinum]
MNNLENYLLKRIKENRKMEIICYLSNGYPTIEDSYRIAEEYADAGCNMIEIDFPSRDPYLESEYIADRMAKSLEACDDYDKYMDSIVAVKKNLPNVKLLVLAYENTVEEIGVDKFINFCLENDFKDILLVGLRNEEIKNKIIENGLRVSCYVQYHLLPEEIEYAKKSNGFVYLQAKPNPGMINPKYPELSDCVEHLRECGIDRPIYCGVGVHAPEDVKMVKEAGGDAAFVGSTILKLQTDIPAMKDMIRKFKEQC